MTEEKLSPFKLTRSRLLLLFFIVLGLVTILATIFGGLDNYRTMREGIRPADGSPPPVDAPAVTP